ncbi:putative membrane protein [Xylanimonas ulmi]|uniref:Putative membrane protein n=1 Tax=Xylanimonas ulmi TaxID=228973 RepID=A0A4V2EY20_9MICO|nr:putative membrane protein [Xylanibacterium ulmi]
MVGAVAGVALRTDSLVTALLGGWAVGGLLFVVWTLTVVVPMGPDATAEHALREEPARVIERGLVLIAAMASLAGLAVVLVQGGLREHPLTAVAVLAAVVASWASVHTIFALRYARLYYTAPRGGIDFHNADADADTDADAADGGGAAPSYSDFTYVAFTVGMSFAVSDTDLRTTAMRRTALTQALLAYLYGTVIVALLVNLVAGLAA